VSVLGRYWPALKSGSLTESGRAKLHPHWALSHPIRRADAVPAKKRLVLALGSDAKITDAARVMRLPGMLNWKSDPPGRAESVEDHPELLYRLADVLADTPELSAGDRVVKPRRETLENARSDGEVKQKQERFSPRDYVRELGGVDVGSDGKACCPFHEDRTPSLHAYREPERGWYCYGCGVGGDIYTFAALLRGISQRELHGRNWERIWRHVRTFYGLAVEPEAA
jgi:CHC2 zinc finger